MHLVQPQVFLISQPTLIKSEIENWFKAMGVKDTFWDVIDTVGEPEALVAMAAKNCYRSFEVGLNPNISKVRSDMGVYLENILKQGHGSVLEHANFSFAIEGVSRVFTGEMNRHRAGMAISEVSMRFVSFADIGLVETTSMHHPKDQFDEIATNFIKSVFAYTEGMYAASQVRMNEMGYANLPFDRKKQITSLMRRAIGMGVATGGVWTGNIRALRHIITMRGSEHAEEEIFEVALRMLGLMQAVCPILFTDFGRYAEEDGGQINHVEPKYPKV